MKTQIQKNIIIIVSAYSSGALLAPLFNGRGYTCVHLTTQREWDIIRLRSHYREEDFADNFIIDSDEHFEKIIAKLKKYNVKLIIPGCESGVSLADKLSQHFDVPKNDYKNSLIRRNKFEMIETIKNEGLLYANQIKSKDLNDILKWFDKNKYEKIVLKPLASSSSDSVFYCKNHIEIIEAFAIIYKNKNMYNETNHEVLAQEFLDGDEYIVNTVSCDCVHYVSDIWKGVSMDKTLVSNDSYADYVFSNTYEHKILSQYVEEVLDALGVQNGPAHSEIRLTSRGPCLIEAGSRLAGKVNFSVIESICGASQISLTATALLEPELFKAHLSLQYPLHVNKYARYVYFFSNCEGVIKKEPCFDEMLKIESLSALHFVLGKGDRLRKTSKNLRSPRPGYAYLISTNLEKLENDYQTLRLAESNLYTEMLSE
jgi:dapdiamide synthase